MEVNEKLIGEPPSVRDESISVDRYAWVILLVVFLAGVAAPLNQFKVPPLLPVLMEAFRLDLSQAGLLMSIFAVTGLILALPAGLILQRLGPKAAGLIAVGCVVIGSAWGALANSAGLLLASRVLEGVGMGLIAVVGPAVIALWFPREKQGTAMGLWSAWVPVGSVVVFNLAPALGTSAGWQAVWWAGVGFALVAFALYGLLMRLPPALIGNPGREPGALADDKAPKLGVALANRNIWLLALVFACFTMVVIGFATFFPTFLAEARHYSLTEAGFITSVSTFGGLVSAPLSGWLSDRIGSRRFVFAIPFLVIAGMMVLPFHLSGWSLYAFMALLGLMSAAIPTATVTAVPEVMRDPRLVGMGLAVVSLGMNLGTLIGPLFVGTLVETMGWAIAGYWLAPICILGFVAAWMVKVR